MASPALCEYETTARGYKVVYNAPKDFFSYKNCSSCAEGGDAVLMEEGECPRCGCLHSYQEWECCEGCDREWAALVYGQPLSICDERRDDLREGEPQRDLIAELLKARSNYQGALMSDPYAPGWNRICSNFEGDVRDAEKELQEELWECDEARNELMQRSLKAGRTELNEEEQKEMDAMDAWAQKACDALHPK